MPRTAATIARDHRSGNISDADLIAEVAGARASRYTMRNRIVKEQYQAGCSEEYIRHVRRLLGDPNLR